MTTPGLFEEANDKQSDTGFRQSDYAKSKTRQAQGTVTFTEKYTFFCGNHTLEKSS